MGKTGTTSIQTFLEANETALAARHIITPKTLARRNHRRLTMYALNDGVIDNLRKAKRMTTPESIRVFRERLAESFAAEASTWPSDQTIVMTSEQMTRLRSAEEVSRLKSLLALTGRNEIRVIVYVRRQDLAYVSTYSQLIKGGLDEPFRPEAPVKRSSTLFYGRLLAPWAEVFGRKAILLRPFEPSSLKNGDAVDDFMSVIGLDDLNGFLRPARANTSLDAYTVEFLRRLNTSVPRWIDGKENRTREALIAAFEAVSDGPRLRMSLDTAKRFMAQFAESNAAVAQLYLARDSLFREDISHDQIGVEPVLPQDAALRIARALFTQAILPSLGLEDILRVTGQGWNKFVTRTRSTQQTEADSQDPG
jgi:hypothetical protein